MFVLSNAKCRSESRDRLIGTAAADIADRIIVNAMTGALLYGSNGNLAGGDSSDLHSGNWAGYDQQ